MISHCGLWMNWKICLLGYSPPTRPRPYTTNDEIEKLKLNDIQSRDIVKITINIKEEHYLNEGTPSSENKKCVGILFLQAKKFFQTTPLKEGKLVSNNCKIR